MGLRINGRSAVGFLDALLLRQPTHDNLNANANLQVKDADVAAGNPVPIMLQDPGDTARQAEFDSIFQTLVTISLVHHEIHEGDSFFHSELVILAAAATRDLLIVSPNSATKRCHFFFDVQTNDEVNIKFYEGTVTSNDGTAIAEQNRNRGSAETADVTLTHTPTVSGVGTLLAEMQVGGSQGKQNGTPGTISRPEIILDVSGTKYLLRITAAGNNTDVSTWLDWYEHTDS